jgi:hypothetical protein
MRWPHLVGGEELEKRKIAAVASGDAEFIPTSWRQWRPIRPGVWGWLNRVGAREEEGAVCSLLEEDVDAGGASTGYRGADGAS